MPPICSVLCCSLHKRCSTTTPPSENSGRTSTSEELQITVCLLLLDPPLLDAARRGNPSKIVSGTRARGPTDQSHLPRPKRWRKLEQQRRWLADLARDVALLRFDPVPTRLPRSSPLTRENYRALASAIPTLQTFSFPPTQTFQRKSVPAKPVSRILSSVFVFLADRSRQRDTPHGSERARERESATPECEVMLQHSWSAFNGKGRRCLLCLCCGRVGGLASYAHALALARSHSLCVLLCCRWFMLRERERENE